MRTRQMFQPPYKRLYIYSMNGRVREADETGLGDGFLGNWVEGENSFLFFSRAAGDEVAGLLKQRSDLALEDKFDFSYEQWQGGGLAPVRIDPFLIVPPWLDDETREGELKIRLDPGVVFGNCLHPTTADCLRAVAWCHARRPFRRVMDIGTCTGVLALAAALLGAASVTAVDLNPLCVKTAAANAASNGLERRITVKEGGAEDFADVPADLVVANIHFDIIEALLRTEGFRKRERLVLSGLMRSQAARTADLLAELNYRIERQWTHEMTWYTMAARRT